MESFSSWEKKIWPTENTVRPNRDDSGHVLIMTIRVSLGSERTIGCTCIKQSNIKSHKIRSVASRSRCIMIRLDKLFIHQLELKSLYSILQINDTKSMRNGRSAPWSSVIWLFETPKCDGENCCYYVLGYNDTLSTFWQWQVEFGTGLREIQSSISSTRSVRR
jgi:hypothetical protein